MCCVSPKRVLPDPGPPPAPAPGIPSAQIPAPVVLPSAQLPAPIVLPSAQAQVAGVGQLPAQVAVVGQVPAPQVVVVGRRRGLRGAPCP